MPDSVSGRQAPDVRAVFEASGFQLESIENESAVIYSMDGGHRIFYCNAEWNRFAADNGAPELFRENIVGSNLFDFISPALTAFYQRKLQEAQVGQGVVQFDYECSSAEVYRVFQMRLFPLAAVSGWLVVNSLRVSLTHRRTASDPSDQQYAGPGGYLRMCCHCRRTQRRSSDVWDWVPFYLKQKKLPVTHTLCNLCLSYFYPSFAGRILKDRK